LGDEDLLEIIGNSKDVKAVQRHFNKMYAGITTLSVEKEGEDDLLLGMSSKEGESVDFEKSVNVTEDPRINIWLTKVDEAMTTSLASLLEKSLKEISVIEPGKEEDLLKVIEKYPA
jgi:dynein heavy chain 1